MVHNLQEEGNKNIQSRRQDFSEYLTEEELACLIAQVEAEGMLHAPKHMKSNVLKSLHVQKEAAKEKQLLLYQLRIAVTTAAAIAVLILMPAIGAKDTIRASFRQMERKEWETTQRSRQEELQKEALKYQQEQSARWQEYQDKMQRDEERKGFFEDIQRKLTQFGIYFDETENT